MAIRDLATIRAAATRPSAAPTRRADKWSSSRATDPGSIASVTARVGLVAAMAAFDNVVQTARSRGSAKSVARRVLMSSQWTPPVSTNATASASSRAAAMAPSPGAAAPGPVRAGPSPGASHGGGPKPSSSHVAECSPDGFKPPCIPHPPRAWAPAPCGPGPPPSPGFPAAGTASSSARATTSR